MGRLESPVYVYVYYNVCKPKVQNYCGSRPAYFGSVSRIQTDFNQLDGLQTDDKNILDLLFFFCQWKHVAWQVSVDFGV